MLKKQKQNVPVKMLDEWRGMLLMSKDKLPQAFRNTQWKNKQTLKNWGWFKTFAQYCILILIFSK